MAQLILAVDDSEDLRDVYAAILEAAGYEVATAADGEEAFAKIRALRPDLVISDIAMPNVDGFELLDKMRSDLAPPLPPVILCSGFDVTEAEALRRGALMFLRKPFARADLLEYIAEGLRHEQVPREVAQNAKMTTQTLRDSKRALATTVVREIEELVQPPLRPLGEMAQEPLRWLCDYFANDQADLILIEDSGLRLVAHAGEAATAPQLDVSGAPIDSFRAVVESGSTLVVGDVSHHPCFGPIAKALPSARFFAGAPLTQDDGTPLGLVCVADAQERRFSVEDLSALQLFALRGSVYLGWLAEPPSDSSDIPGRFGAGVLIPEVFAQLMSLELMQLRHRGGSIALALLESADDLSAPVVSRAVRNARERSRLVAGMLSGGRAAVFKRDAGAHAAPLLHGVVDEIVAAQGRACVVGLVELGGDHVPGFDGVDLMRMAELALERAIERGAGGVQIDVAVHDAAASL